MSVLVLGATGFIGPRLIRRLVARGETVVGVDLNPGAARVRGRPDRRPRAARRRHPVRGRHAAHARGQAGAGHQPRLRPRRRRGQPAPGHAPRHPRHGQLLRGRRLVGGIKRVVYASSIAVSGQQSNFGEPPGDRGRSGLRHQPVRDAQDLQRVPGPQVHQELRHVDRRRASGQRHRARQGPRLRRPRADHDRRRARQAGAPAPEGPDAAAGARRGHGGDLRPRAAGRGAAPLALQLGRHPGQPRRAGRHRARLPAGRADHVRAARAAARTPATIWSTTRRLGKEFGIEFPGLHTRVLEVINDVRRAEGLPLVTGR